MNKIFNFTDTGVTVLSTLTLEEFNSITGQKIIPRCIERKDNLLFAADIKEPAWSDLVGLDNFDSRSYSFDPDGVTHLFTYGTDKCDNYTYNTIKNVPKTHDCYNKYTDVNQLMYEKADLSDTEKASGVYDRFDKDGYYGGSGVNISWRFVETEVVGDTSKTCYNPAYGNAGTLTNTISLDQKNSTTLHIYGAYIKKDGTLSDKHILDFGAKTTGNDFINNYSDAKTSYLIRSLRRDELYRFGIVLYDQFGTPSPAKWITDVRTPSMSWRGFETFASHGENENYKAEETVGDFTLYNTAYDLGVRPLGVEFTINKDALPKNCTGYEIVRCNRTVSDIATVSQGVVSRPITLIHNPFYKGNVTIGDADNKQQDLGQSIEPYTPTGLLTTARYWAGWRDGNYPYGGARHGDWEDYDFGQPNGKVKEADNVSNATVYLFISPEVAYQKETIKQLIDKTPLHLNTEKYVFGSDGGPEELPYKFDDIGGEEFINPSVSNLNLRIMLKEHEDDNKTIYAFDKDKKSWGAYGCPEDVADLELVKAGINLRFEIFNDYKYTPRYFYKTRPLYTTYKYVKDNTSGSKIFVPIFWKDQESVMSCSAPSDLLLFNLNPITIQDGNPSIFATKYWPSIASKVSTTIKLYEQSNKVYCRKHMKGLPSVDFTLSMSGDRIIEQYPISQNVLQSVDISDTAFPDDLAWTDFAKSSTDKNGKETWALIYPDKITTIGNALYCNWVTNSAFNVDVEEMAWSDGTTSYDSFPKINNKEGYREIDQTINGPSGRCMLIKIDNNWNSRNVGRKFTSEFTPDYYSISESFLLSDTIATSKSLLRRKEDTSAGIFLLNDVQPAKELASISTTPSTKVSIFRNSILGTYICNLRKLVTPYGGSSYTARLLNSYYSYGDYHSVSDDKVIVFSGDCYIMPFEYTSLHKYFCSKTIYQVVTNINYAIPLETNINLAMTYGSEPSRIVYSNINTTSAYNTSYVQLEPSNVGNRFTQKTPEYAYNTVYSTNSTARVFQAYNPDAYEDDFNYRCRYSNKKESNEYVDSWCKFMPANYLDVDSKYGQITDLRTFRNYLFYWQDKAFGRFSVNERIELTDQTNMPLILGSGGVLTRYDYVTEYAGMKANQFVDAISPSTIYWWDYDGHTIWGSNGLESTPLSKLKYVLNILNEANDNDKLIDGPCIIYDRDSSDVIMRLFNENTHKASLVYNEQAQSFVALDDITPHYALYYNNCTYLASTSNLYRCNAGDGKTAKGFAENIDLDITPYVKYIVNKSSEVTKVFDNAEFGGRFYGGNTSKLLLNFTTPLKQASRLAGDDMTNREYSFRYSVPRNNKSEYGDRMRGKFMACEIASSLASLDFSLEYVINTFRTSWS